MWLQKTQTPFNLDQQWQNYTPLLLGATDNPVVTGTSVGRWQRVGNRVDFNFTLISTTMTKTTLTDAVRVSLPLAAANSYAQPALCPVTLENGTPVLNATIGQVINNTAYLQLVNFPLTAASAPITYALLSLGVLTNTITFRGSGYYEV